MNEELQKKLRNISISLATNASATNALATNASILYEIYPIAQDIFCKNLFICFELYHKILNTATLPLINTKI